MLCFQHSSTLSCYNVFDILFLWHVLFQSVRSSMCWAGIKSAHFAVLCCCLWLLGGRILLLPSSAQRKSPLYAEITVFLFLHIDFQIRILWVLCWYVSLVGGHDLFQNPCNFVSGGAVLRFRFGWHVAAITISSPYCNLCPGCFWLFAFSYVDCRDQHSFIPFCVTLNRCCTYWVGGVKSNIKKNGNGNTPLNPNL